jgi:DNA repair protein RecN (Recombination protein N)
MLTHIAIKNFTIVESLNLDVENGLSVLTGETGAGKSILVDAVSLAMGARAEGNVIRRDATQCDISLCFDISLIPAAQAWLKSNAFDSDDECVIRRIIAQDGKSRSHINGHPCSLNIIREFSELILNIYGQHQHQALLKRDNQQTVFDIYAHHQPLLEKISQFYQQWQALTAELAKLKQQAEHREHEFELLRYQFDELNAANLTENEWRTLSQQHNRLQNAKTLIENLNQAIDLMADGEPTSAADLLQQAIDRVNEIKLDDPPLLAIKELLNTAAIHLTEASNELNHYRRHLDLSDDNLEAIEERLTLLHDLARKHHVNADDLIAVKKSLEQRIQALENIDKQIEESERYATQILQQYEKVAEPLTNSRQKYVKIIEKLITDKMQHLGMTGGRFQVRLEPSEENITPYGKEKIAFYVSTNPGQEFMPLAKVVSGGELSRIGLALQVITAQKDATPTLIFDEVDTGIGGKTAEMVGQLLRELGEKTQVFCITHLPQVAAKGHHHLKVEKLTTKNDVSTQIQPLSSAQRIEELARMLSGTKITQQTLAHAEELLN